MSDSVNVILYGVGNMGMLITRYLYDKGFNIVGAINRSSYVGEDLGFVAGLEHELGVEISNEPDLIYRNNRVDVAIVSTTSDMVSFVDLAKHIVARGVNLLTLTEEAFWPWRFAPEQSKEVDQLARDYNVTVAAGGLQDTCLLHVISALTGGCNSIESMRVVTNVNLDLYGSAVLEHYPIGLTQGEYESAAEQAQPEEQIQPIIMVAMEALIAKLKLNLSKQTIWYAPIFADEPVQSVSLGRVVDKGLTIGHTEHVELETEQGIIIRTEFREALSELDEPSRLTWEIKGVPDIDFTIDRLDGEAVTCASLVNRIPDIIAAEAGFLTCDRLPAIQINIPQRTTVY